MAVNKSDGTNRARLVAKGIKTHSPPELCAATPPIDSLKYLIRRAVEKPDHYIIHANVTRAYFYAQASRDIYVKCPTKGKEPGDKEKCSKLLKAMHGTRDAAQIWQRKCSEAVR